MEIKGILHRKYDTQEFGEKGFKKREFVLLDDSNPTYPETIKMELTQANCSLLDGVGLLSEINVSFNLKGRSYTGNDGVEKFFTNVQVWKMEVLNKVDDLPF